MLNQGKGAVMALWIDAWGLKEGQIGFVIKREPEYEGKETSFTLEDRPAYGNGSNAPEIWGWAGTDSNVAVFGNGVGRVTRITASNRARIELIGRDTAEEAKLLEELGYGKGE
jgi:hypothetical protein